LLISLKEEGRREEGRRKKEEGRRREGRGKKQE
jgi:hypothetical protein